MTHIEGQHLYNDTYWGQNLYNDTYWGQHLHNNNKPKHSRARWNCLVGRMWPACRSLWPNLLYTVLITCISIPDCLPSHFLFNAFNLSRVTPKEFCLFVVIRFILCSLILQDFWWHSGIHICSVLWLVYSGHRVPKSSLPCSFFSSLFFYVTV